MRMCVCVCVCVQPDVIDDFYYMNYYIFAGKGPRADEDM